MLRNTEATDIPLDLSLTNPSITDAGDEPAFAERSVPTTKGYVEPRGVSYSVTGLTAVAVALALTAASPQTLGQEDASVVGISFDPPRLKLAPLPAYLLARAEMESYRHLHEGWDGLSSVAPREDVLESALAFLDALPVTARAPESTVSGDGSVGWFWKTPTTYASVNFSGNGRLVYFGETKSTGKQARGTYIFDGETIPQDLLEVIATA